MMARVTQQRSGKQNAGPGFVKGNHTAKQRKKQKVVLESNTQGQNKGPNVLSFTADPPPGWTFIPAGNPQLTNALKEAAQLGNHKIMSVSTTPHAARHELSRVVHRVGYHFPTEVVSQVCAFYGIRLDSRGRQIKEDGRNGDAFSMKLYQKGLVLDEKVNYDQVDINTDARETIKDLFPNIPDKDLFQIIKTAFQKGQGKVGTADEIPLVRRAQLSVVAHIRHVYTKYDKLIRQIPYNEARHAVEQDTLKRLVEWAGDAGAQDAGKKRAVDDIFREVIVLSDDEASDSEGDDAGQIAHDDLRVEELPMAAYAPASLRPSSPRRGYPVEEVSQGFRIVEAPLYRYPAREVDLVARDRDRYARWEQARQQYRPAPPPPAPVYERVYEPLPERQLIPLDPPAGQVIERHYLGPADARQFDTFQAPRPRQYSPPRYEQRFAAEPRFERIVTQPGYATPPVPTHVRRVSPPAYTYPTSRPLTPTNQAGRRPRRTPSLDNGEGSILPSIEGPNGGYSPSSGRRNFSSNRPKAVPFRTDDIIDVSSSVEQRPRYRQMDDVDIGRANPFERRDHRPAYDPRERSPHRSPEPRLERRIVEVDAPQREFAAQPRTSDRQYREVREVDNPTPRRIYIPQEENQHSAAQQDPFYARAPPSYTRVLEPLPPSPREPVVRRIVYPEEHRPVVEPLEPIRRYQDPSLPRREYVSFPEPSNPIRNQDSIYQNQQEPFERRVIYAMPPTPVSADRRYERLPETTYIRH